MVLRFLREGEALSQAKIRGGCADRLSGHHVALSTCAQGCVNAEWSLAGNDGLVGAGGY